VTGATVLVHGVLGGVGSLAAQLAPGDTKKRRGWLGSSMPYPELSGVGSAPGIIRDVAHGSTGHASVGW